jgi:hypothetical protein
LNDIETTDRETKDTDLLRHRQQFNDYVDSTQDERKDAEINRDYFDNIQWDARKVAVLQDRGQPVITDNKIKDKVEYMMGVEQKTRTDPKAYPRTPKHEQDSEIATDSIRYVFDLNRFPTIKSSVFQDLLVEGFGAAEVIFDKDKDEVVIHKCRWDRLYRDPYSMEPDCKDARYFGLITWMDFERAKEKWPHAEDFIEIGPVRPARSSSETHDDKPRWVDAKRKRVQVFDHYEWRKGKLMKSVFCWGGYLERPAECPYLTDDGEHDPPLKFVSAYVSREGRRYGLVSRYVPLQDEVNQRRSAALHHLVSKGVIAEQGAVESVAKTREEIHRPDYYVEVAPDMRFEVEKNLELSAGHFQLLVQAENALSMTGPNAALLGQSGAISGRAKELDQQGGALQVGVLFDVIRSWQQSVARSVWYRIKQYWDTEDFIRVTDDDDKVKFIALNQPITRADEEAERLGQDPKFQQLPDEEKQQLIQALAADPAYQQPVLDENGEIKKKNDISKIDVDIVIDEAPDTITVQAEQFEKLARLMETGRLEIPPDVLIEASQLPSQTKKRIMDAIKGTNNPMAAMQAQFQQMMQQLEGLLKEAEVRETNASADLKEAQAEKTQVESVTRVVDAATPDHRALQPPGSPSGAQKPRQPSPA